jgi:hypothetical protein
VPALGKLADEWCQFACSTGCSIHDHGRPPVCREYNCYWLDHEEIADELRPDRLAIIITDGGYITVGGDVLRVLLLNQSHPRAADRQKAKALIDGMVARGMVVMILYGDQMRVVFDEARYPTISSRDVEVAFCYEQSQDAEELKRLGAVGEEYRLLTWEEAEARVDRYH